MEVLVAVVVAGALVFVTVQLATVRRRRDGQRRAAALRASVDDLRDRAPEAPTDGAAEAAPGGGGPTAAD